MDLDSLGGRLTVVNLWVSWCSIICREEMEVLQAAHTSSDPRVLHVGVDVRDEPGPAARFLTENGLTYPQLYEWNGREHNPVVLVCSRTWTEPSGRMAH